MEKNLWDSFSEKVTKKLINFLINADFSLETDCIKILLLLVYLRLLYGWEWERERETLTNLSKTVSEWRVGFLQIEGNPIQTTILSLIFFDSFWWRLLHRGFLFLSYVNISENMFQNDLVQDQLRMLLKEGKENNSPTHSMWTFNLHKNFFGQLWHREEESTLL